MTKRLALVLIFLLPATPAHAGAVDRAKKAFARASDNVAQLGALELLKGASDTKTFDFLLSIAATSRYHFQVTDEAERMLREKTVPQQKKWLIKTMKGRASAPRRAIIATLLANAGGDDARDALVKALKYKDAMVVSASARALQTFKKDKVVVTGLVAGLDSAEGRVKADIIESLNRLTGFGQMFAFHEWDSWWGAVKDTFDFTEGKNNEKPGPSGTAARRKLYTKPVLSKKVIFVVDVSGSMEITAGQEYGGKSRLDYVRFELNTIFNRDLKKDTRFNLIIFSNEAKHWKRKLIKASPRNKRKAREWLEKNPPPSGRPVGATNSKAALLLALDDPDVDTVYFLSDGQPTAGDIDVIKILGEVRGKNRARNIKIHAICFLAGSGRALGYQEDKSGARHFMEKLAKENKGEYRAVE